MILYLLFVFLNVTVAQQNKDKNIITIASPQLKVFLNPYNGLPQRYLFRGIEMQGDNSHNNINIIVCQLRPRKYINILAEITKIQTKLNEVDILYTAFHSKDRLPTISFHLKYVVDSCGLAISLENISERTGFEFIETSLPALASVSEQTGTEWLANSIDGGSLVSLKEAKIIDSPEDEYFGKVGYVLPVAIIGTNKVLCAMEVRGYMDGMLMKVSKSLGRKKVQMGTVQTFRIHGGRSYEMNDGGPRIAGNENTPNILVGQKSLCRIDFTVDYDKNGLINWLDAAKLIAARMPTIPTTYFNDKFAYLVGGKYKMEKIPRTTFAQSEQLIHDIAMLTDGAAQLCFISGWNYDGQDTGFPSEDSVNATLGGFNALKQLMKKAEQFNTRVSLNTNYDDAYKSSPVFNYSYISKRPDGKIWKGRDWAGDTSYIVGMAKYIPWNGLNRINYSIDHYDLKDAILIDALSWFSIRNDWDPIHPASGFTNLNNGKFKVIEAFRQKHIELASEQLRYPFIGKIALSADGCGDSRLVFGGEPIPLVATIYRKSAIWGAGAFSSDNVLKNLFFNCRPMPWFINVTERKSIADFFYLTVLIYNKIHNLEVVSYNREGYKSLIGLGKGYQIIIDWFNSDYSVKKDNVEIAGHYASFCSLDSNRLAFYSREQKELSAPLPEGWNENQIVVNKLYADHREALPINVIGGRITVLVPAGCPVIVYRNKEASEISKF